MVWPPDIFGRTQCALTKKKRGWFIINHRHRTHYFRAQASGSGTGNNATITTTAAALGTYLFREMMYIHARNICNASRRIGVMSSQWTGDYVFCW